MPSEYQAISQEDQQLVQQEKSSASKALKALKEGDTFKSAVFIPILPANETLHNGVGEEDRKELSDKVNLTAPSRELLKEGAKVLNILQNQEKKDNSQPKKKGKKNKKANNFKSSIYPALLYLDSPAQEVRNEGHNLKDIKSSVAKGDFEIVISAHGSPNRIGTSATTVKVTPKDLADQFETMFNMIGLDKSKPITFNFNTCNNATVDYRFAQKLPKDPNLTTAEKKEIVKGRDETKAYSKLGRKEKDKFFIENSFIGKFATSLVENGFENVKIKGVRGYTNTVGTDAQKVSFSKDNKSESQSQLASMEDMEHRIIIKDKQITSVEYPLDPALASKTVEASFEMFEDRLIPENNDQFQILNQQIGGADEQRRFENQVIAEARRENLIGPPNIELNDDLTQEQRLEKIHENRLDQIKSLPEVSLEKLGVQVQEDGTIARKTTVQSQSETASSTSTSDSESEDESQGVARANAFAGFSSSDSESESENESQGVAQTNKFAGFSSSDSDSDDESQKSNKQQDAGDTREQKEAAKEENIKAHPLAALAASPLANLGTEQQKRIKERVQNRNTNKQNKGRKGRLKMG